MNASDMRNRRHVQPLLNGVQTLLILYPWIRRPCRVLSVEYKRCSSCIPGLGALTGYYQWNTNAAHSVSLKLGALTGYYQWSTNAAHSETLQGTISGVQTLLILYPWSPYRVLSVEYKRCSFCIPEIRSPYRVLSVEYKRCSFCIPEIRSPYRETLQGTISGVQTLLILYPWSPYRVLSVEYKRCSFCIPEIRSPYRVLSVEYKLLILYSWIRSPYRVLSVKYKRCSSCIPGALTWYYQWSTNTAHPVSLEPLQGYAPMALPSGMMERLEGRSQEMRAVRLHRLESYTKLSVDSNLPIPIPRPLQVLVRIHAVGVNPSDVHAGSHVADPDLEWPVILGTDGSGVISEVGSLCKKFFIGDRVFFCKINATNDGSYAEYITVDEDKVFPLPLELSFEIGAALGFPRNPFGAWCTWWNGQAMVQVARNLDLRVLGTAESLEGRMIVQATGENPIFGNAYTKDIQEDTEDIGVDIIVEMLPELNLTADMRLLASGGRVAVVGDCHRSQDLRISSSDILKEAAVIGVHLAQSTTEEWEMAARAILEMIEDGNLSPLIHAVYPLEEAFRAHQALINAITTRGKIYSDIYRDEELIPGGKKNEATWCTLSRRKLLFQEVGLLLTADAGVLRGRF
ncbi:CRYZ [Cordylochernes scorpioides]|uniref:CRYZ n=1 Tax=Cordylochernes scorpioides TaxID=51811 RepID=A0ABY6K772_9ARAC|nr:CRYZ [Cordylochernes scorpioides]